MYVVNINEAKRPSLESSFISCFYDFTVIILSFKNAFPFVFFTAPFFSTYSFLQIVP